MGDCDSVFLTGAVIAAKDAVHKYGVTARVDVSAADRVVGVIAWLKITVVGAEVGELSEELLVIAIINTGRII